MSEPSASRASWFFWLIAAVSLLWNAFGAYDYWMSHTAGERYLADMGMTDPQIAYFIAMPAWMTAVWALGVWGAVAGSLLLLLRSRWATTAFAASLAGLTISLIYTYLLSDGGGLMGALGAMMNLVITFAALFFVWFSRRMMRRGVLR